MSTSLPRLSALCAMLALAAVGLAGCPGSMGASETGPPPQQRQQPAAEPQTVVINVLGNRFDVDSIAVPRGSTVIWHNTTSADHGLISDVFDVDLRPGQDYQYTFHQPGTYHIRSRSHVDAPGLQCWIIVQ
jgi:plastocyanin